MKVAYFDCSSGISGDMLLGALVDAGLPLEIIQKEVETIGLNEVKIHSRKVKKHGISATKIDVITSETKVHRNLNDVLKIIHRSAVSKTAKKQAERIFRRLAKAEAEVHGTDTELVRFHEVGAIDAIIDILGTVTGLEHLGVKYVHASCLRFGQGTIRGAHGVLPIPVPAVVSLCKGLPTERTNIPYELVTPTGAAILSTLAVGIGQKLTLHTEAIGYGAGDRNLKEIPNLLRVEIGILSSNLQDDAPWLLETNIDDMNPEIYGYLIDRLLEKGARDAYLTPLIMKKGRPGIKLSVLSDAALTNELTDFLFRETTTLGIRRIQVRRTMVSRKNETVKTPFGTVKVKIANVEGLKRVTPEFEDCVRIAREQNVPILDIYKAVDQISKK